VSGKGTSLTRQRWKTGRFVSGINPRGDYVIANYEGGKAKQSQPCVMSMARSGNLTQESWQPIIGEDPGFT